MSNSDWANRIDRITNDVKKEFGVLSVDQLNWKPNEYTWSIAQNLDHLVIINESYFPIIQDVRKGTYSTPFIGRIGFLVNFFGKAILNGVKPDRRRKTKTFPIWEPQTGKIIPDILNRFEDHQSELKQMMTESQDLVEKEIVISSPANRNVVYKLGMAFEIIVTHEQRHLEQAKEVKNLIQKS